MFRDRQRAQGMVAMRRRRFRAFVARLGPTASRVFEYTLLSGRRAAQPLWQMLQHVVNHGTYHRGQVTTMLRQLERAAAEEHGSHRLLPRARERDHVVSGPQCPARSVRPVVSGFSRTASSVVSRTCVFPLAQAAATTKVVCGTTVIPSNPNVDRKLVKPIPDQATKFTLRKIPPAACRLP